MGGSRCGSDEQCMDVPPSTECDSAEGQEKPFCPRDIFSDIGTLYVCVFVFVFVFVCVFVFRTHVPRMYPVYNCSALKYSAHSVQSADIYI